MLRPWSQNAEQNPAGWQGKNWRGLGYDIYAYFPEFPPDGDPTNDNIGDPGSVGSQTSDFQVDYQDTSADFWRIVDAHKPRILITTSRGSHIPWELEAIEGGHGETTNADPSEDWISDRYGSVTLPTQATIDARSWEAISKYRTGKTLTSRLPLSAIKAATKDLGEVEIENGTSGNYLSGFMGLHGLFYNKTHAHNVAAGHIHVGREVPVNLARNLIEASVIATIQAHPPQCE